MSEHHLRYAWKLARTEALERDGYRCRECGKAGILEVHHIQHVRNGGSDALENLTTLCRNHHIRMHSKPKTKRQIEWQKMLRELTE